ncbi:hypothetical protein N7470_001673 [Penicillium chermesinum]|nr:hypothetical protein N7470_001673 [Penicillium chermesinum]
MTPTPPSTTSSSAEYHFRVRHVDTGIGTRKKTSPQQNAPTSPDDMQNRIDRLEGLVLSLMTNGSQSSGRAAALAAINGESSGPAAEPSNELDLDDDHGEESDTEQVTKSFGVMKMMDNNKSYYISEAHWATVLNDIAEVRQFFTSHKQAFEDQANKIKSVQKESDVVPQSTLLFGVMKPLSRSEIIASMPSKYMTDLLVARYFNTYDPATHILHGPTFQAQYNKHWEDPSQTDLTWIAMLFALMRLAMLSYKREGDEPPEFKGKAMDMAGSFRNLFAHCVTLADYTKPHPFLIEALVFHLHGDFTQTREADVSVWVLPGVIARLAMRMGYHRDSKMFPNISPFQGEMRRRVWSFVRLSDVLFSFQVGLPSLLRAADMDTELPQNLYDDDFDEHTKDMPALAMNEFASSVMTASYDKAMELDTELRRARDLIPDHLQIRPIEECQLDPVQLIMSRFSVHTVYHKAQIVLHRPYLVRARENPRFTYSRRTCIDSAIELLGFQRMFHAETRHGRLRGRQTLVTSLSSADFLLAATIACLDLYQGYLLQAAGRPSGDTYTWGRERRDEMITAVQGSKEIWDELRDQSMEAWKASNILGVMLSKLHNSIPGLESGTGVPDLFEPQDEKQNAAMTLGLLSSGMSPMNPGPSPLGDNLFKTGGDPTMPAGLGNPAEMPGGPLSPFSSMFGAMPDMQSNLDWDAWDTYIQNPTLDASNQFWPMMDATGLPQGGTASDEPHYGSSQAPDRIQPQGYRRSQDASALQIRLNSGKHAPESSNHRETRELHDEEFSSKPPTPEESLVEEGLEPEERRALERDTPSKERIRAGHARSQATRNSNSEGGGIQTVYIGNLFWDLKAEDLRAHMEQYGTVISAMITHDNRGLSKGFGYVQYSTIQEARLAIERQDMQMLHGRQTVVRFARTQMEQTQDDLNAKPSSTLFIGNIPYELTDRDLQDLFIDVYNFTDIRIPVDRRSGTPRGYAHAEFIDIPAAEAAREILRRKFPYGRKLKVQFAHGIKKGGGPSGSD